ncbi:MAG: hypothetical protein J5I92_10780 [Thiogranum sp.]|nr:hypothetical protein [Thiogranum sp.]
MQLIDWFRTPNSIRIVPVIGLALCSVIHEASIADVWVLPEHGGLLTISEEIKHGDYDAFVEAIKTVHHRNVGRQIVVDLNTPGGDLVEAMRIGHLVRELGLVTRVDQSFWGNGDNPVFCGSSCFFILVAGLHRSVSNGSRLFADERLPEVSIPPIGIHRPFFSEEYLSHQPLATAKAGFTTLEAATTEYLKEMGVPLGLIEKMNRTPSNDLVLLTEQEFAEEIGETAPYVHEWIVANCGNISNAERADWHLWKNYKRGLGKRLKLEALSFSDAYGMYLDEKVRSHGRCYNQLLVDEQKKNIDEFLRDQTN